MKTYEIYIVDKDGYGGAMKTKAENESKAMQQARQYIRVWKLGPATIEYCKEVEVA